MYFFHTKITMYYTQKNHIQKMLVFFPYKNYYVVHTQKITYKKLPYKNLLCILTHKNCHTKMLVFFYTHKKYYVIHAKITSIFTIQKLLCSAPIQKLPYKRLPYIFSHTKITMYYTHKNCHTFLLCIFSHTKITMYYTQKITYKKC